MRTAILSGILFLSGASELLFDTLVTIKRADVWREGISPTRSPFWKQKQKFNLFNFDDSFLLT